MRVIIPQPPGGVLDTLIRSLAEPMRAQLGQPIIVDNRPGGNNAVGLEACALAPPDGYTLCAVSVEVMSIYPHVEPQLYARWASLQPVTLIARNAGVLLAHPSLPVDDLAGFVRWARGRRDLNYGSSGEGSVANLLYEWLKQREGLQIEHVPYRGIGEAFNELAAGRVQVSYIALGFALQHIQAGRVKPLAVLGAQRSPHLPNTPSLGELGYDFPYDGPWWGFAAPANTPLSIMERIAAATRASVLDPEYRSRFLDPQAYEGVGSTPAEFASIVEAERRRGVEIARAARPRRD
ncbi:MAG: tripartite tricarboxylate transporter substrate binding protein [Rhodovarius sp.]|nr:tripartite tricarboxylate transporter substrate binding protein [Rhodovarius sp.]